MDGNFLLEHEIPVRLGLFALVLTAVGAWEALAPRRRLSTSRLRRWRTNLGVALLNTLVLRVVLPSTAIGMALVAAERGWGLLNNVGVPPWVAVAAGVIALDFAIYLQHVLMHHVPLLARIHAAHHADPDFDTTTGIRFHPLEIVLSMLAKYAVIAALGAPALAVLLFELLLNLTALSNHANARLPETTDRWLRAVLVTPDMHRIHHSVVTVERNSNFGFCLSAWDRLFGTYTEAPAAGHEGMALGLNEFPDPAVSTTFSGILQIPFRRQS
jgi:sterol desaturase/sphingolipid hydroxylase (fatty acid hydroxylase superfamily)